MWGDRGIDSTLSVTASLDARFSLPGSMEQLVATPANAVASVAVDTSRTVLATQPPASALPEFQYSPYALLFVAAMVLNLTLALYAVLYGQNRGFDGTIAALTGLLISGAIWTLTRTIQLSTPEIAVKHLMTGLMYFGLGGSIVSGFCFCIAYTGRDRYLTWRNVALLSIIPAVATVLALTNAEHELLWTWTVLESGNTVYISRTFQPAYFVFIAYVYLVMLGGLALVGRMTMTTQGLYRRQAIAAMLGILAPMITGLLFSIDAVPILPNHVDPTPFGFLILVGLFGYSTFRYRLLDLVPVARQTVIEEIDDAIVTIDPEGRVVDCNAAARSLLDVDSGYVGVPAGELFGRLSPSLAEYVRQTDPTDGEVAVRVDGQQRFYSLSVSPVDEGRHDEEPAQVVVLRDVSAIKRREEELDLLRQVQSRVLRHNIRNELTSIRGNAELLASSVREQHADRAEAVIGASDSLLSITEKARLVEEIVDHEREVIEHDLRTIVDEAVDVVQQRYHSAEVTVDGPDSLSVEASPKLDAAVRNLLENACEHNDAETPQVHVAIESSDSPVLRISDNGPGIPDQEIKVLEDGNETQLVHGSGVGLWFVKLVAERSEAELSFDTGPDGTEAVIRFRDPGVTDDGAIEAAQAEGTNETGPDDGAIESGPDDGATDAAQDTDGVTPRPSATDGGRGRAGLAETEAESETDEPADSAADSGTDDGEPSTETDYGS